MLASGHLGSAFDASQAHWHNGTRRREAPRDGALSFPCQPGASPSASLPWADLPQSRLDLVHQVLVLQQDPVARLETFIVLDPHVTKRLLAHQLDCVLEGI